MTLERGRRGAGVGGEGEEAQRRLGLGFVPAQVVRRFERVFNTEEMPVAPLGHLLGVGIRVGVGG